MTLRPYQQDAVSSVYHDWEAGLQHLLIVMATGLGKTITFAAIAEKEVEAGRRVLILAHRGELLTQAADKIKRSTGLDCAVEKADQTCIGSPYMITVGSIQSFMRESRLSKFPQNYWGTIIIDEAHHVLSDGYIRVLDYFDHYRLLGCTATPDRGDMRSLSQVFDATSFEYGIDKGVKNGYLCKPIAEMIPLQIDLTDVATQNGDYASGDLGDALEPYLEQIASVMSRKCRNRKIVVFLPLIAISQKFRDILETYGMTAAEVNGTSEDRDKILKDFDDGKYQVLCNSMLLTEGWDCPSVDCVVVLRPTKVRSLYVQMIGRGLRLHPGKKDCLILDFLWLTTKHDLVHPAAVFAASQEVADQATDLITQASGAVDLMDVMDQAEKDVVKDREEALAKQLAEMRKRKARLVDPLQYIYSIGDEELSNYEPVWDWERQPATEKQLQLLENRGISPEAITNRGQAQHLIGRLLDRQNAGLATPKQIRFLESKGFSHVGSWFFADAKSLIDRIAGNGWKVPHDIWPATYQPHRIEI